MYAELFPSLIINQQITHSKKKAGVFQPKFGSNMDKPKCWVKNAIKKIPLFLSWVKI